jgi:AraC-like DNA-binding protein
VTCPRALAPNWSPRPPRPPSAHARHVPEHGADQGGADTERGQTPTALGSSGATRHDFAGDQQTRGGAAPARPRAAAQHPRDLARLRRVRDRIDREHAQPLDVEALARGVNMSAGHLSREFRLAYGETPYAYLMTRRIERAMALPRRGDLSVTEVCLTAGRSSPGTFSTRFTELVGMPPTTYRRHAAPATAGMPPCVAKQVTRPIRNREAPATEPQPA